MKQHLLLVLIVVAGLGLRLYQLSDIPQGVSHDELEYINNGYSIFKTGRDLYGNFLPLSVGGVSYVAIPAYLAGLSTSILGLNPFAARIIPVIFGVIEIYLIYLLALHLFKKKSIALASAFILAFSVWGIYRSRTIHDSSVSLFFFLWGMYLFIKQKKLTQLVFASVLLSMGMLSYYGSLFVSPFVFTTLFFYRRKYFFTNKKAFLACSAIFIIAFGILARMLFNPGQNSRSLGRTSEVILFDNTTITDNVIFTRSISEAPPWFNRLTINKVSYLIHKFSANYFGAFSPAMIFVNGDSNRAASLTTRGEIDLIFSPFCLLGIYLLVSKFPRERTLILLLLLIAPISSGLSQPTYSTRAFLLWPILILLGGVGLGFSYDWISKKHSKYALPAILSFFVLFALSLLGTINDYFFRYPTYSAEIWFESEKQLANYLISQPDTKFTVYSLEGRQAFMEYFFYAQLNPAEVQKSLTKTNVRADISFANVTFINGCLDPDKTEISNTALVHTGCVPLSIKDADELILTRDGNNSAKWAIFHP